MDEQQNRPELPPGDQPEEQPTRAQPPAPRRLLRSRDDRVIAGVCAGLGRYFDVDPVLFRIAAVALTFFGGAGALLYLAAVLLVPTDGDPQGQRNLPQRGLALTGIVLLVVAGGSILSHGPFHFWLAWPVGLLLLVGLGIWWLISAERSELDAATNAGQRLLRGILVLIASAILAVGGAWLAGTGGATIAAIVIIAAGGALAFGAFTGGARWLILPALALVLPVAAVSAAGIDLHGGAGDREYNPVSAAQVRDSYRVGAGRLVVDLRQANLPSGDRPLKLRVGAGQAALIVPDNVCVATRAKVGIGEVRAFDVGHGGVDVDWSDEPAAAAGNARVVLDADVGLGQLLITDNPDAVYDHHRGGPFPPQPPGGANNGCEVPNATR
jgi:phage shock protein PspC (stress-responsive transcriptional regulator)